MEDLEACRLALTNARREIREKEAAVEAEKKRTRVSVVDGSCMNAILVLETLLFLFLLLLFLFSSSPYAFS